MGSERNDTMPRATVIDDEAAVQSIFCVFDTNDDGILDKDEVENFAKAFRCFARPCLALRDQTGILWCLLLPASQHS